MSMLLLNICSTENRILVSIFTGFDVLGLELRSFIGGGTEDKLPGWIKGLQALSMPRYIWP